MSYVDPRAGSMAAQIAGQSSQMDMVASRGVRAVQNVAAGHRLTGAYISKVFAATVPSVVPSKVGPVDDRLIVADDEAAVSIEYGHIVRFKNARRVRFVPGQHIMAKALKVMG
ncbi:DUF5403 family protein [Microbacterium sp. H6]|uniref:DUF5403 family protein n=1 Tax=Microbacterium sp. H6 TaxID=421122 RepID=UPI000DE350BA|nr:DUF5403 family protein [Microbacterium sp. H6]RBO73534.1 hypothetical protein DSP71_05095 [Microbacterium sp. H6]